MTRSVLITLILLALFTQVRAAEPLPPANAKQLLTALTVADFLEYCEVGERDWNPNALKYEDVATITSLTTCYVTFYAAMMATLSTQAGIKTKVICLDEIRPDALFQEFVERIKKLTSTNKTILENNAPALVSTYLIAMYPCGKK